MTLVTLSHGTARQAVWARDSYSITVARLTFALAHGIAPGEVAVDVEYAVVPREPVPTSQELAIINAA